MRQQLLGVANRSDGSGSYLFGGQGSSQPPFVDSPTPGGVQFIGTSGQLQTASDTAVPLSSDGVAGWLNASTGNGVFVTQSASNSVSGAPITGAWIDAGSVTNPSALFPVADTGYRVHFTSSTTYDIESYSVSSPATPPTVLRTMEMPDETAPIASPLPTAPAMPAAPSPTPRMMLPTRPFHASVFV